MALEETHLDVLQNIEFAIVSVYREQRDLRDYAVMRALDALIGVYRAEQRGHVPKEVQLPEPELSIFQRTKELCELRLGRQGSVSGIQTPVADAGTADSDVAGVRKALRSVTGWFGRQDAPSRQELPLPAEITVEEVLACLRKVRRSVDRWNKRNGPQGYLQFVQQYIR
jgi:hypothetical protein